MVFEMKAEITPRHIPLVQKPSCCNSACLQMILLRNEFGFFSQEEIAKELDVKISEKDKNAFGVKLPIAKENEECGIKTIDSKNKINNFFASRKLPLVATAHKSSGIINIRKFIFDNIKKDNDIWVEFHLDEREKVKVIHDNLIQKIDCKSDGKCFVTTIDPWWGYKQIIDWPLDMLKRAIGTKYGRECGFIIVSKKKQLKN